MLLPWITHATTLLWNTWGHYGPFLTLEAAWHQRIGGPSPHRYAQEDKYISRVTQGLTFPPTGIAPDRKGSLNMAVGGLA